MVTVLIPARNEEADIDRCLQAVLQQDYPHDRIEVVLVDGASTDLTASVAKRVLRRGDVDWTIVHNPAGTTPSNLNAGLAVASGEILCRVDARSVIPADYIRLCAEILTARPEVMVTGGAQITLAVDGSFRSLGIARALNNRYAMGGSRYRSGRQSGPSDTVYLGAFRTRDLRSVGGWDPYFATNQDYELNRRLGRMGLIWFDDRLAIDYVPRSTLTALWRQYHRFGRWKVRYWRRTHDRPQARQLIPLIVLPVLLLLVLVGLARSPRPRPMLAKVGTASAISLLAVDAFGAPEGDGLGAHVVGGLATLTITVAWVTGVAHELVALRDGGLA